MAHRLCIQHKRQFEVERRRVQLLNKTHTLTRYRIFKLSSSLRVCLYLLILLSLLNVRRVHSFNRPSYLISIKRPWCSRFYWDAPIMNKNCVAQLIKTSREISLISYRDHSLYFSIRFHSFKVDSENMQSKNT